MMKVKVLCDIDGVIASFYRSFAKYLNSHLNTHLDLEYEPDIYSIYEWDHKLPRDTVDRAVGDWMLNNGFLNMPIYKGAQTFIYKLIDKYDVFIVTARIGDFNQRFSRDVLQKIVDDTKKWFQQYGIPADKLFFRHDKIDFCKEQDIHIIIEDKLSTALKGAKNGIHSILLSHPWNKDDRASKYMPLLLYRADNYDDILNIMEKINAN
jgi:uncharacterized HAD superfamily protein